MTNWAPWSLTTGSSTLGNTGITYYSALPSTDATAINSVEINGQKWDGPKNEASLPDSTGADVYRQAFAWTDPEADPDQKDAHKFIHHVVDADGNVGAAHVEGARLAIAALNNPRSGGDIPEADRKTIFNHLIKHLREAGVPEDKLPKLMSKELLAHMAAANRTNGHESGTNNGPDPTMNESQIKTMTAGQDAFVAAGTMPETEDDPGERFVKSLVASGSPWGVQQRGQEWKLFDAEGKERESFGSYHDATNAIAKQLAVVESRNVLPQPWRSEMTFEGVDTGDGRYIMPGACKFRDCPMPLMLQTETEVGHFGAVLAGTIEQAGMVGTTAVGTGSFDNSEAGNQAVDIINARGRFGVSVDIGESEADFECTLRDPEYDECIDGMVKFTLAEIMGLTMTPFPAFADAYIEIPQQTNVVAASGAPEGEVDCVECKEETEVLIKATEVVSDLMAAALVAAAAPSLPPAAWFEKPEFKVGDGRLAKQPNGGYACPLTVTPEGQVYGHLAAFKSCHTSYSDRCVPPPRSPSGYAYFTTGAVTTEDGKAVRVGQITMGAGHASTGSKVSLAEVKAHYDGGPGAVQMADVAVGEDEYGIWFSGSLRPDVTEDQIRAFTACGVSGDWREVNRHKGLDLVACAAGIPVPGFPVARALAAAGIPEDLDLALPDTRARFLDGEPVALVAAGVVKQPMPWERMIATQQNQIDDLRKRVAAAERVTSQLRGEAAEKLVASLTPATEE